MPVALARVSLSSVRAALRLGPQVSRAAAFTGESFSPPLKVKLLVLQATPFCNIDCSYCYLPNRASTARMSLPVIEATMRNLIDSGLLGERLGVAWHAGEPLTAGLEFYRRAFACIDAAVDGRCPVQHSFQTNAMLIDQGWCDLFAENGAKVGVSVDGPAFLHDRNRKTRDGKGTHARAMQGVAHLLRNGLPFHAIAVVTAASLEHADEIFDFFLAEGFREVGFNIDEREGERRHSTLGPRHEPAFQRFLQRMLERSRAAGDRLRIREIDEARRVILHGLDVVHVDGKRYPHNAQVLPLEILSVDHAGNFSTFSPELLGQRSSEYADFVFGNVLDDPLASVFSNPRFQAMYGQIVTGVERCRVQCQYFELCGGGAPANKLYENGSFSSTDTAYCRNVVMAPLRLMLSHLEQRLQP
jgi:uncharacterized protein